MKILGVGTVATGRIASGKLKYGTTLSFCPGDIRADCKTIEMHHVDMEEASCGDNVGFRLSTLLSTDIKRGMVVSEQNNSPATEAVEFEAVLFITNHPTEIKKGYTPQLLVHTAQTAVKFEQILEKLDPVSGQTLGSNPESLKTGDSAIVRLVPKKPICIETHADYPILGSFIIRDMNQLIGYGTVRSVKRKPAST